MPVSIPPALRRTRDLHRAVIAQRYPLPVDDGRGLLPDQIAFGAPVGMRADLKRAASTAGTSVADFIRAAVVEKLEAGVAAWPGDGSSSHAGGLNARP